MASRWQQSDAPRRETDDAPPSPTEPPSPRQPARRRVPTWLLVVAGVVLGGLLGLAASALLAGDDDEPADFELAPVQSRYPDDQGANVEAFLQAWQRHRNATYRAELTFSRDLPNGQGFEARRTVVQDPPRRAVRQFGSVATIGDDSSMLCEPLGDDTVCTQQEGTDYDAEVAAEIAAWRTAITGDRPAYALFRNGSGCFELQLVASIPDPPYGDLTQVCFDDATGALRSRQVLRATSTEIERVTSVSPTVTEADWQAVVG